MDVFPLTFSDRKAPGDRTPIVILREPDPIALRVVRPVPQRLSRSTDVDTDRLGDRRCDIDQVDVGIDGLTDMIPTVSLKTDTSMLETPYAYQTRITGGRMAYTIDSSQGEYATNLALNLESNRDSNFGSSARRVGDKDDQTRDSSIAETRDDQ